MSVLLSDMSKSIDICDSAMFTLKSYGSGFVFCALNPELLLLSPSLLLIFMVPILVTVLNFPEASGGNPD
jgi:hypothetical protein